MRNTKKTVGIVSGRFCLSCFGLFEPVVKNALNGVDLDLAGQDGAGLVDNDVLRNVVDLVQVAYECVPELDFRTLGPSELVVLDGLYPSIVVVVHGYAEDFEAFLVIHLIQFDDCRVIVAARVAPGCPEIDHDSEKSLMKLQLVPV